MLQATSSNALFNGPTYSNHHINGYTVKKLANNLLDIFQAIQSWKKKKKNFQLESLFILYKLWHISFICEWSIWCYNQDFGNWHISTLLALQWCMASQIREGQNSSQLLYTHTYHLELNQHLNIFRKLMLNKYDYSGISQCSGSQKTFYWE